MKSKTEFNDKKWDVCWFIDGKCKEVVLRNAKRSLALWKKAQLSKTTYRVGLLVLLETGTHKY